MSEQSVHTGVEGCEPAPPLKHYDNGHTRNTSSHSDDTQGAALLSHSTQSTKITTPLFYVRLYNTQNPALSLKHQLMERVTSLIQSNPSILMTRAKLKKCPESRDAHQPLNHRGVASFATLPRHDTTRFLITTVDVAQISSR